MGRFGIDPQEDINCANRMKYSLTFVFALGAALNIMLKGNATIRQIQVEVIHVLFQPHLHSAVHQ